MFKHIMDFYANPKVILIAVVSILFLVFRLIGGHIEYNFFVFQVLGICIYPAIVVAIMRKKEINNAN